MTSRLEYTLENIAKRHLEEIKDSLQIDVNSLSIEEIGIIEESLIESKMIAELCLSSCEECDKYMTHDCVKVIFINDGDEWCEDLLSSDGLSIDDYLEEKFRHR